MEKTIIRRVKIPKDTKDVDLNEIFALPCVSSIDKMFNPNGRYSIYVYLRGSMVDHFVGGCNSAVFAVPGDTLIEYENHKWEVAGKFGCKDK
jgi:hypothetical protein